MANATISGQYCKTVRTELGDSGRTLIRWIKSQLEHRGSVETISMMKSRENYIRHLRAEDKTQAEMREFARSKRISVDDYTLIPKGIWGVVAEGYLSNNTATMKRFSGFMKGYTSILPELTQEALDDLKRSITEPLENQELCSSEISKIVENSKNYLHEESLKTINNGHLVFDLLRMAATKARFKGLSPHKFKSVSNTLDSLMTTLPSTQVLRFMILANRVHEYHGFKVKELFEMACNHQGISIPEALEDLDNLFGALNVIPKAGGKGRVIAKLNVWDQLSMIQIHDSIDRNLTESNGFYHRDQYLGAWKARQWMIDYHSHGEADPIAIDLSNATDRIPRELVIQYLNKILGEGYATKIIESISDTKYSYPKADGTTEHVKYSVGQPMGMYGSFPLLQLSNALVADEAVRRSGIVDSSQQWYIIGDDIVFKHRKVGEQYKIIMNNLGVETNFWKEFSNNTLQFAGFEINKIRKGDYYSINLHRPMKWKPMAFLSDRHTMKNLAMNYPRLFSELGPLSSKAELLNEVSLYKEDGTPWISEDPSRSISTIANKVLDRFEQILLAYAMQNELTSRDWSIRETSSPFIRKYTPTGYDLFGSSQIGQDQSPTSTTHSPNEEERDPGMGR